MRLVNSQKCPNGTAQRPLHQFVVQWRDCAGGYRPPRQNQPGGYIPVDGHRKIALMCGACGERVEVRTSC